MDTLTDHSPASGQDSSPEGMLERLFPAGDGTLAPLRGGVQVLELAAGQVAFRPGDPCLRYLVVAQGSLRVQVLSANGREITLYRVTAGESCVVTTSCLISGEVYPAFGVSEETTTALAVPQALFDQALGQSAAFRRFVFAGQGERLGELIQRVEDVAFGRIDARLARLLLDLGGGDGQALAITHQQLAAELGSAREVVSRQLKRFERAGWVAGGRGSLVVLQPTALQALAADPGAV